MSHDSVLGCFRRMLSTGDHSTIPTLYADGALFDINVPEWRYQLRGPESIRQQLDEWHPQPPELVDGKQRQTPWSTVVELALWEGDGHELYSRSIHLLDIGDDPDHPARHVLHRQLDQGDPASGHSQPRRAVAVQPGSVHRPSLWRRSNQSRATEPSKGATGRHAY